jgi:hypothetical protein
MMAFEFRVKILRQYGRGNFVNYFTVNINMIDP